MNSLLMNESRESQSLDCTGEPAMKYIHYTDPIFFFDDVTFKKNVFIEGTLTSINTNVINQEVFKTTETDKDIIQALINEIEFLKKEMRSLEERVDRLKTQSPDSDSWDY